MRVRPRIWTGLGFAIVMIGLSACGAEAVKSAGAADAGHARTSAIVAESVEAVEGEHGEVLSLPKRLAFMSGHVQAGLALYRAGEPDMAAPHLLHPVSETHASERAGLNTLGFEADLFEAVSQALSAGKPASALDMQLLAAEANLNEMAKAAGGEASDIITFLMETIVVEYGVGVPGETVEVAGEYQDAFGFAVVALGHAKSIEGDAGRRVRSEIRQLIELWPEAPVPPSQPAPISAVRAQTLAVLGALP